MAYAVKKDKLKKQRKAAGEPHLDKASDDSVAIGTNLHCSVEDHGPQLLWDVVCDLSQVITRHSQLLQIGSTEVQRPAAL